MGHFFFGAAKLHGLPTSLRGVVGIAVLDSDIRIRYFRTSWLPFTCLGGMLRGFRPLAHGENSPVLASGYAVPEGTKIIDFMRLLPQEVSHFLIRHVAVSHVSPYSARCRSRPDS